MRVVLLSPCGEKNWFQNRLLKKIVPRLRSLIHFMVDDQEFIPNLALLTIAGFFPKTTTFKLIDEDYSLPTTTISTISEFKPDLVCITAISHQWTRAIELITACKQAGFYTILGGSAATERVVEAVKMADTLITGEAEAVFPSFLDDYIAGRPLRHYKGHSDFVLDISPLPRFDLLDDATRFNRFPIFVTRGCPHTCEYCGIIAMYGHKLRHKSIERVCQEIQLIKELVSRPHITFADENITVDVNYAQQFFTRLRLEQISFDCYCDISVGKNPELLQLMYNAGCREIAIGLESIVPESLAKESRFKAKMLSEYSACIEQIQSTGISVFGLFIVGLDGDGPDVFDRILAFCDETALANAEFAALSPIPGTPIYHRLLTENRLISTENQEFRWEKQEYLPSMMTPEELTKGIMRLYAEFHHPKRVQLRRQKLKEIIRSGALAKAQQSS
jgi:radical SAM superfamily enzyme YgiQ (UPF0313 family)